VIKKIEIALEARTGAKQGFLSSLCRLERSLKRIALRLRLLTALNLFSNWLAPYDHLAGSLSLQRAQVLFPYLPSSITCWLGALVLPFLWESGRTASRHFHGKRGQKVEEKAPHLKDDVTNSILLFHEFSAAAGSEQVRRDWSLAQSEETADEVSGIHPRDVVLSRGRRCRKDSPRSSFCFHCCFGSGSSFSQPLLASILDPLPSFQHEKPFSLLSLLLRPVLRGTLWRSRQRHSAYRTGYP